MSKQDAYIRQTNTGQYAAIIDERVVVIGNKRAAILAAGTNEVRS